MPKVARDRVTDEQIRAGLQRFIDHALPAGDVLVAVADGVATLTGHVQGQTQRQAIYDLVGSAADVWQVVYAIDVEPAAVAPANG